MKKIVVFLALIVLVSSFGFSQQRTGNIRGQVVDEDGVPIPGVTVTCISDLIGQMAFITTDKGSFRFISLSPGMYVLRAELEGFSTVTREKVLVQIGSTVTIELKMVIGTIEEEITVTAASPVVDTKKTTVALNLTVDELEILPTARDPFVILRLAPGVTMDRENVGGSQSGQQSRFVARGLARSGTNWNVDGIDTTDQISVGAASQYFDFDSFEEIQIQTAATDITSFTAGVQVNLVTKRGSNRFSGGGRLYYSNKNLQSDNKPAEVGELGEEEIQNIADYGVNVGGPLFKDKLWFWAGYGTQAINRKDLTGATIKQNLPNVVVKLNMILGKHRIEGFFNFSNSIKHGRVASSPLDAPEARYDQWSPHPFMKIQDEISVNQNLFVSLKGSYAAFGFELTPVGGFDKIAYRDDATGNRYWNTYRYGSDYGRTQYFGQALGVLFAEDLLGANHEFKFGVELKHSFGQRDRTYVAEYLRYRDYAASNERYAYIYRPKSNYDYRINRFAAFFQDSISLGRFTIMASMRYDRQWSWVKEMTVPGSNVEWAGDYNLPSVTVEAQDVNVIWNTISPRLGIIYDITGDGKTVAKLNFGIYGERYSSSIPGNLASTFGYVYFNWDDTNNDELASADEVSRPRVRDSYTQLDPADIYDPNMVSPKTLEITAGIERELLENFGIGGTFIYRKNYDDYWDPNYVDDGGTLRLPTPDDWVIAGNIPAEWGGYPYWDYGPGLSYSTEDYWYTRPDFYTRYLGFEVSFKKRLSSASRWLLNGSFTIQDWKRYYPTRASYNSPTNVEQMHGEYAGYTSGSSGATDQSINPRWMAKLGFAVQIPFEINVGGTLIARDGYIFRQRYEDLDYELESSDDDSPIVYTTPYGKLRLPNFYLLNLRVGKTIRIQRASFILSLDLFNVFNSNTTLSQEDIVTDTNYEQILQYLSPRILRLGIRFKF